MESFSGYEINKILNIYALFLIAAGMCFEEM